VYPRDLLLLADPWHISMPTLVVGELDRAETWTIVLVQSRECLSSHDYSTRYDYDDLST
jgi:hypothetical protein